MAKANNSIIQITSSEISGEAVQGVNARELHGFLGVDTRFNDWLSRRIEEYEFVENKDFVLVTQNRVIKGRGGDRRSVEYFLSLDMAKELAMVEKTEKGKEARRYFIECERKLKEELTTRLEAVKPLALPDKTMKHWWLTMNSSGRVLAQVELKDASCVSEKVDEVFPDAAVLNRQAVIEDMDEIMGMMYEMTTKVSSRMNRLIPVLGTPTNATQEDVDKFWKSRVRKASDRLARAADRMESAA